MAHYSVRHCVLTTFTRQFGPQRQTSNLHGVEHYRTVTADVEFPCRLSQLELFVRFYVTRPGAIRPVVRVTYLDARDGPQVVYRRRFPDLVAGLPVGLSVYDCALKLVNLSLPGVGSYVVGVYSPPRTDWDGRKRRLLGSDFFWLSRAS